MLTEIAPADELPGVPRRYVQLSSAYAADADNAARDGFEVVRAEIGHLGLLSAAAQVKRLCFGNAADGE